MCFDHYAFSDPLPELRLSGPKLFPIPADNESRLFSLFLFGFSHSIADFQFPIADCLRLSEIGTRQLASGNRQLAITTLLPLHDHHNCHTQDP